jgi:hypothetical protein
VRDVELSPFYRTHRRSYVGYWDLLSEPEFKARISEVAAEKARVAALEAATLAVVVPGDPQTEKRFNQQGEETTLVRAEGRPGRRAAKWFSYELSASSAVALVVTYNTDNRRARSFEILVNGERVAEVSQPKSSVSRFVDVEYPLPAAARGSERVTVRFQATGGNEVAPVFAVRLIRGRA